MAEKQRCGWAKGDLCIQYHDLVGCFRHAALARRTTVRPAQSGDRAGI